MHQQKRSSMGMFMVLKDSRIKLVSHLMSLFRLLLVMAFALACQASFAQSLSIITYGDSITAGLKRTGSGSKSCPSGVQQRSNGNCYGNGVQGVGGYQPRLKSLLVNDGNSVLIYNYGVSGIRTDEMLDDLNGTLNARSSSNYVLIMGGANDAYSNFSRFTVRANLLAMVNRVKSVGKTPILATVTPNTVSSSLSVRVASYNTQIREIATSSNIILADQFAALNPNWSANQSGDNLHVGSRGDSVMADTWYARMQEALNPPVPVINGALLLLLGN